MKYILGILALCFLSGCATISSSGYIDLRDRIEAVQDKQETSEAALRATIYLQQKIIKYLKQNKLGESW